VNAARTVTRALRQPSDEQHAALLAGGWLPAARLGWYVDRSAGERCWWWQTALAVAAGDRRRGMAS
jgi:hypothetical protein